ncbi:hypothetical protein [Pseudovibrio sp. Tun.PSC04-5.I4]|uniref:hypothetical protein n=1 Tax=Pseudovibrio sp. Tun.PSC04-5.I4 TaxID=1798213 RepID=UPI0008830769|nr:hypothetical protein [Pseudovibrio sp. Tun.PSC04-5.I4]SDR32620.1 hypothetical protein SAMN04515695_4517 [Pseudovibrio sp. Tun.PSC04-5.I4]
MRVFIGTVFVLLLGVGVSFAASELKNENLLVTMPDGYKVAYSDRKKGLVVSEMIPKAQSLEDWQDMVTVQVHFSVHPTMSALVKQFTKVGNPICEDYSGFLVRKGRENGYEFGLFLTSCSITPASKSEKVLTKAILGKDSTYFVIKSWRSGLDEADIVKWSGYMAGVKVCDSRIADSACP